MDRHDPHDIFFFSVQADFPKIHFPFCQLFHISDELKQTVVIIFFVSCRTFRQHLQIGLSLSTGRHGCCIVTVSCLFQDLTDQHMYRCMRHAVTETFQLFKEADRLLT